MKKNKTISIDHNIEEKGISLAYDKKISFSELVEQLIKNETKSLLKEEKLESIENALYSTKRFTVKQCTDLADGILLYINDNGCDIVKANN